MSLIGRQRRRARSACAISHQVHKPEAQVTGSGSFPRASGLCRTNDASTRCYPNASRFELVVRLTSSSLYRPGLPESSIPFKMVDSQAGGAGRSEADWASRRVGVGVTSHPSHRSGRAQLRHPARRTTDSLRPLGYPLVVRAHGVRVRSPARVSLQRPRSPAPPSLDRVPAAAVPRLPRYYEALRFPTNLHDGLPCRSPVVTTRWAYGGVAGRPKFLGNPLVPMPCSRTPAGPEPPGRRVG